MGVTRASWLCGTHDRLSRPRDVDVNGTMRSRSAVAELAEEGVLSGYPTAKGAEFKPGAPLLRAQLAKMHHRCGNW